MAQKKPKRHLRLPSYLEKCRLLYSEKPAKERLKSLGDLYLEQDWLEDALDFYQRAEDLPGLERLKARAIETGDASILVRLEKSSKIEVKKGDWQKAREVAIRLGKEVCAQVCFDHSGELICEGDKGKEA